MRYPQHRFLALLFLGLVSTTKAIWPFPSKRFPQDSLVGTGAMGIDDGQRIVAFGDFNGDQLCASAVVKSVEPFALTGFSKFGYLVIKPGPKDNLVVSLEPW